MSSFIRDSRTQMVINTNDSHYQSILQARHAEREATALRKKLDRMDKVISEVEDIKQQLEKLIELAGNKNVKTSS